ncbi:hypothetical protein L596_010717 [Steinernema carpocapsae]|uniref:SKP1 component POZ domain-containing protein n=1 Tax=Steinernema carpocapsae TaxID=34508 RepID=A0A4U5PJA8_STECR|nr:hypothetical protein L596_010717 [Steinernema carpocapsae]
MSSSEQGKKYGGCEGPDAEYVKLVSSDGHEFFIRRELAVTSGTIKAMLSGAVRGERVQRRAFPRDTLPRAAQGVPVLLLQEPLHKQLDGDPRVQHSARSLPGAPDGGQLP